MASSAGAAPTDEPEPQENMDALLDLDAEAVASGVEAGRRAAAARSTRDGFALGYSKGGELAVEARPLPPAPPGLDPHPTPSRPPEMARLPQIGGYDGFLSVWEELLAVQPDAVPARTRKAIGAMRALVDAFPCAFPLRGHKRLALALNSADVGACCSPSAVASRRPLRWTSWSSRRRSAASIGRSASRCPAPHQSSGLRGGRR